MFRSTLFPISCLLVLTVSPMCYAADDKSRESTPAELAARAASVLERSCLQCHRGAGSASKAGFDVRDVKSMIDYGVVIPKDSKGSLLWELAHRGTMPPRSQPQIARIIGADAEAVAAWIDAGAPEFPKAAVRTPIALDKTLSEIEADLRQLPELERSKQRYFSLIEAYNNPALTDDNLRVAYAALAKGLNSLSWERELADLRPINASKTLFAINIEKLGWTKEHWKFLRSKYPYVLGYENLKDTKLKEIDSSIQQLQKHSEPLYMVRADWFLAIGLQPTIYHALLYDLSLPELIHRLPDQKQPNNPKQMTAKDLEKHLNVDVPTNIVKGNDAAMRSGFTPSGVSGQNRLLERHKTKFGAYWKSYDFKADNRRAILSEFPLGPNYPGNASPELIFEHDGGEVIYHLPNGLQGYLLIDGQDRRIDAGPIEVVSDALKTSGTSLIVNGLSCMSCHKEGMIDPPADEIRNFASAYGKNREHLLRLYPTQETFQEKVDADGKQFMTALDAAIGKIVKHGPDAQRSLGDLPEPVSEVARLFLHEELDLKAVAAELHEPNVERLRAKIEGDESLQKLGLGILLRPDGKIKRAFWESSKGGTSVMQLTAFVLGYSTPSLR
jgi:mono/diheme cytochrome c family protein